MPVYRSAAPVLFAVMPAGRSCRKQPAAAKDEPTLPCSSAAPHQCWDEGATLPVMHEALEQTVPYSVLWTGPPVNRIE
jgi:hypothetical protein